MIYLHLLIQGIIAMTRISLSCTLRRTCLLILHCNSLISKKKSKNYYFRIKTICLPEPFEEFRGYQNATALGWGVFQIHGKEVSLGSFTSS